ncbi:cytochrome P450 [Cryphonectria parasitica EP155]|uniref:Cytochrome P450 n=1 Tax=Cryphonectria parasitica (strain ATCC 38755 / EP155) TaxID=660469 RepID=A0A9P4YAG9_CRYP1|nr:cytochrome P450 [Cryphonectria parasitica EP155]KAF3769409.1 cytochrome P450 [Cryphonectria parasitica EP155]
MAHLVSPTQVIAVTAVLIATTFLYTRLYHRRFKQNAHLPQLPSSLFWGHLAVFNDFIKRGSQDRHPDAVFAEMHEALGKPDIFLVDNWPVVPPMAIVASHEVAEQVSHPSKLFQYSAPKSSSLDPIISLIGPKSILRKQNEEWKEVRRRFNPGFAPQHLMSLLPVIVAKCKRYIEILDHYARSGAPFPLDQPTTNLTFDIIGAVTMGEDMNAQHLDTTLQGQLIIMVKKLLKTYADDKLQLPWWLAPRLWVKRHRLGLRISQDLRPIVRRNFEEMKSVNGGEASNSRSRSVLALSLIDVEVLTPEIMEETCDQLKTFLFAGHDTTSTTIIWSIYELLRTPRALDAVNSELDRLFGPRDADASGNIIREKLLGPGGQELVHRMMYISAVIKEVLRLHPPAGSIRTSYPGTGFVVSTKQGEYNLDGDWIYLNHNIMGRDRAVFGDTADDFVPERWLDDSPACPASAWRPFERGPRNCIGQELANIEARVILAMLTRRYEFSKVGLGEFALGQDGQPLLDNKGRRKVKSELYSTIQISGKPVDAMMMKVKLY